MYYESETYRGKEEAFRQECSPLEGRRAELERALEEHKPVRGKQAEMERMVSEGGVQLSGSPSALAVYAGMSVRDAALEKAHLDFSPNTPHYNAVCISLANSPDRARPVAPGFGAGIGEASE